MFRPLLNISAEFSAEEFETALITPNDTLSDIHIPILKVGFLAPFLKLLKFYFQLVYVIMQKKFKFMFFFYPCILV